MRDAAKQPLHFKDKSDFLIKIRTVDAYQPRHEFLIV